MNNLYKLRPADYNTDVTVEQLRERLEIKKYGKGKRIFLHC